MGKDSVPNRSTISTIGQGFKVEIAERMAGRASRIITESCVTIGVFASTRPEMSTGGSWTMLKSFGLMEDWITSHSAGDMGEVTAKIVRVKL
jgi:hypothetical protein